MVFAMATVLLGSATQSVDCWFGYEACVLEQPVGDSPLGVFLPPDEATTMMTINSTIAPEKMNHFFLCQGRRGFA